MTHVSPAAAHVRIRSGTDHSASVIATLDCIPYWFIALAARIFPAAVFWQSGETKVAGWHLKPSAIALFQNEYQLPLIDPTIAAYASAFSEHFFPILLVIGFATRFSALALLFMTAVIEIFVYPGGLADPWSVGNLLSGGDRAGARLAIARPFYRAQISAESGSCPAHMAADEAIEGSLNSETTSPFDSRHFSRQACVFWPLDMCKSPKMLCDQTSRGCRSI